MTWIAKGRGGTGGVQGGVVGWVRGQCTLPFHAHRWVFTRPMVSQDQPTTPSPSPSYKKPHSHTAFLHTSLFIFLSSLKANQQPPARDEDEQCHHGILKEKAIKQRPWRGSPRAKG
ncbi:hypothetical protein V6N13_099374 [Hibiscus sabdariffa]|uniref:Uncharacterized protein n=1 Tax=Hibiscus sabdariffa TaxID=183260 RepID=A0ABR2PZH2_9ROSI